MNWNDNSNNEDGFRIERKLGAGGAWGLLASTGANQNAYEDSPLSFGQTYYYRVYAYNGAGNSQFYTNEACATTLAAPVLTSPNDGASFTSSFVTLQWNSVTGATGYGLDVGSTCGGTNIVNGLGVPATSYVLSNLSAGQYFWRVKSVNGTCPGLSDLSNCRSFAVNLGPTATWITPPPSSVTVGQTFQVAWQTTGSPTHVNIHWDPDDPTLLTPDQVVEGSTRNSTVSPNTSPYTLTAPTIHPNGSPITGPTITKYVVHVRNGSDDGYSEVVPVTINPVSASCAPDCGAKLNVACLGGNQRLNSAAVGLLHGEHGSCTAWVFAAPDVMITNAHCVKFPPTPPVPPQNWCEQYSPSTLQVRFFYECDSCQNGSESQNQRDVLVNRIMWVDDEHDFALLEMNEDVADLYGALRVTCENPPVGDDCYLIHHALGGLKGYDEGTYTVYANNPGNDCPLGRTTTIRGVYYTLWSKGGASGSPVLSFGTDDVQALNNRGYPDPACTDVGFGIPMSLIIPQALPHLDGRTLRAANEVNSDCLMQVFNDFYTCLDGPLMNAPIECDVTDLNGDGFVDLRDFSVLQNVFTH